LELEGGVMEPRIPSGLNVLVVEDDPLVSMTLEDMLEALGANVAGPARTLEEGFALLDDRVFDLAILDVSLGRQPVFPLAAALQDRGITLLFTTGYDRLDGGSRFEGCHVLSKPYTTISLAEAMRTALSAAAA
jgi:DNA-binding response OmpR family regulator